MSLASCLLLVADRRSDAATRAEPAFGLAGGAILRRRLETPRVASPRAVAAPGKIVIVGGGAAGFAAAEILRREGFANAITMLSDDAVAPVDRPNLSKDYLAGEEPEDWMPLRPDDFYSEAGIDLRLNTPVVSIDSKGRSVHRG